MNYSEKLTEEYAGKKVTVDLDELFDEETELDWDGLWNVDDEEDFAGGNFQMSINWRDYDEDGGDEELVLGIAGVVDEERRIESIEILADIFCRGDSGLGDCDPEEAWTDEDYEKARVFLDMLTK